MILIFSKDDSKSTILKIIKDINELTWQLCRKVLYKFLLSCSDNVLHYLFNDLKI